MANECLKRTPTSSGNRKKWTWAGWVKINKDFGSSSYNTVWSVAAGTSANNSDRFHLYHYSDGRWVTTGTSGFSAVFTGPGGSAAHSRDPGSWIHICLSVDTTESNLIKDKYQRFWVNGVEYNYDDAGNIADNANLAINGPYEHIIGRRDNTSLRSFDGHMSDLYLVDGQALTPDVFGFYKDGDGYMSSGTRRATDFKPGQWSPRLPKSIKHTINRSGGFGANGFYLPMNDSSNPGADFHCDPNSIITLKGEDLPQPRNGAPTTSDAYVSQLRTDPYAANLVLAVPGISTATGANLISNGNFDSSNLSDWTVTNNTQSWNNGQLQINRSGGTGATSYQTFTTVAGQRYTVSGTVNSSGSRGDIFIDNGSGLGGSTLLVLSGTAGEITTLTGSFTASSTTSTLALSVDNSGTTIYVDNIVVKQEDAPRDYSADIKGSGSNKTLTVNGNAGVGYELGGYYGSAMTFDGTGDNITMSGTSDFNFGTNDFTIESWVYPTAFSGTHQIISCAVNNENWQLMRHSSGVLRWNSRGTNDGSTSAYNAGIDIPLNQWSHVAVCLDGTQLSLYMNGVCVGTFAGYASNLNFDGSPCFGAWDADKQFENWTGFMSDMKIYKGVAKYKGGFDVPKPYTPVGIESWRQVSDTCKNNFCIINSNASSGKYGLAEGNLSFTSTTTNWTGFMQGTLGFSTGKWYWETRADVDTDYHHLGIIGTTNTHHDIADTYVYAMSYQSDGRLYAENNNTSPFATNKTNLNDGDIFQIAVDMDNKKMWFGVNGNWIDSGNPSAGTGENYNSTVGFNYEHYVPFYDAYGTAGLTANFGQNPTFGGCRTAGTNTDDNGRGLFAYDVPTGFLALCDDNFPAPAIPDPGKHFKAVLWTGDGNAGRSITGVGFKPDLIWIKDRGDTSSNSLFDSVRGPGIWLGSNSTSGEQTAFINVYNPSFDNDGFSVGTDGAVNGSGSPYVAWCWKAGGNKNTFNIDDVGYASASAAGLDGGTISPIGASVSTETGFSILTYQGNGTAGANIAHGLSKAPELMIHKSRDQSRNWYTITTAVDGSPDYLYLNLPNEANDSAVTAPTSSLMYFTSSVESNKLNEDYIVYCWHSVENFSKVGTYLGNGDPDGSFVYCGFKPAWVMVKRVTTGGSEGWPIYDSSRGPTNPNPKGIYANSNGGDNDASGRYKDFLSNGFKIRGTSGEQNTDNVRYLYVAFAESPFQTANAK